MFPDRSDTAESFPAPPAPTTVRRFVLVAGANRGVEDRPTLRYAVSDAERFVSVMQALGGVSPEDVVVLRQPRLSDLDGDGDLDLLNKPYTWETPRVDVWLNNGTGPRKKGK